MIRIGLTGSIGMGKSTVAAMFAHEGVPIFDADATVHRLQGPNGALLPAIEAAFPGTTGPMGVDRAALGQAVFGNSVALRRLEAIVHPAVAVERMRFLRRHRARPMVILDVPLLFEKPGRQRLDHVIVVSAPLWIQRRRVMRRPGMTATRLHQILARQLPDQIKRARADSIIETGCAFASTQAQVRHVLSCLRGKLRR